MLGSGRYRVATLMVGVLMLAGCGAESSSDTTFDPVVVDTSPVERSGTPEPVSTAAVDPTTPATISVSTAPETSVIAATTDVPPATPPPAESNGSPTSLNCTSDPYVVMSIFQPYYDEAALVLQRRLAELGFYDGKVDGYFGWDSARALEAWGNSVGVGGAPYNVDNNSVDDYILEQIGVMCPGPKSGCKLDVDQESPTVFTETGRRVQQRLADLGYDPGDIDGYFGPNSAVAAERWHQDGSKRIYYWGEGSNGFSITEKGFDELGITCQ